MLYSRGYRLGQRIGKGTYAKVRVAERIVDNTIVAAKIVDRNRAAKEFTEKFLPRELSILLAISHPNIVKIYEIIHLEDLVYVMMEFAVRGDLLDHIKRRAWLREEEAGLVFAQICEGVDYLHGRCICHRDLKCENVLLRKDMSVALSDFGFSRVLQNRNAMSTTFCGSAAYASPELLRGRMYKPIENDVWSLGCILFIMVTGQMPFSDKNTKRMMYRQLKGKVNFPETKTISSGCRGLITNTLEPNTDLRYDIKTILAHPWLQPFVEKAHQFANSHPSTSNSNQASVSMSTRQNTLASAPVMSILNPTEGNSKKEETKHISCATVPVKPPNQGQDVVLPPDCTESHSLSSDSSYSSVASDEECVQPFKCDYTALDRMPGEACILHGNSKRQAVDHTKDGVADVASTVEEDLDLGLDTHSVAGTAIIGFDDTHPSTFKESFKYQFHVLKTSANISSNLPNTTISPSVWKDSTASSRQNCLSSNNTNKNYALPSTSAEYETLYFKDSSEVARPCTETKDHLAKTDQRSERREFDKKFKMNIQKLLHVPSNKQTPAKSSCSAFPPPTPVHGTDTTKSISESSWKEAGMPESQDNSLSSSLDSEYITPMMTPVAVTSTFIDTSSASTSISVSLTKSDAFA